MTWAIQDERKQWVLDFRAAVQGLLSGSDEGGVAGVVEMAEDYADAMAAVRAKRFGPVAEPGADAVAARGEALMWQGRAMEAERIADALGVQVSEERAAGAAEERERVVRWLNKLSHSMPFAEMFGAIARDIERGEHAKEDGR